jgi:N6-L-threonylcarbamoyladenine synthase
MMLPGKLWIRVPNFWACRIRAGPQIEQLAINGDPHGFDFPKAIAPRNERRFSFSGLKTSLRYRLEKLSDVELANALPDICASYQSAVIDQLRGKTRHLLSGSDYKSLGLSGGVSNNQALRVAMADLAQRYRIPCLIAEPRHTGDNAGMIAFAAFADQADCVADSSGCSLDIAAFLTARLSVGAVVGRAATQLEYRPAWQFYR